MCSHLVGWWTQGDPALEPSGYHVGPDFGEKMVASRKAHASEYSQELPSSVSLSPQQATDTLPLQETLQYEQVGLA